MGNSNIKSIHLISNDNRVTLISDNRRTYFATERFPIGDRLILQIESTLPRRIPCVKNEDTITSNYTLDISQHQEFYQLNRGHIFLDHDIITDEMVFRSYVDIH